jgi:hypothetical protein
VPHLFAFFRRKDGKRRTAATSRPWARNLSRVNHPARLSCRKFNPPQLAFFPRVSSIVVGDDPFRGRGSKA